MTRKFVVELLLSPTDRELHSLGTVSSLPEKWGCDILIRTDRLWVGVQRKAIPDFIASIMDGRLAKEVQQMAACGRLDIKCLLIEGEPTFTSDGVYMGNGFGSSFTLAQFRGVLWSARERGLWVDTTRSIGETRVWLRMMESWAGKDKHSALDRRPGAFGAWGKPDSREWGCHFLQGFPGIGPEIAGAIYDEFNGLPFTWAITEQDLMRVKGIGRKRAKELWASFNSVGSIPAP